MNELVPRPFVLGEFTLDPASRSLRRDGELVALSKLPFSVLVYLIERRDRVVTRAELIEQFWEGKDVYDDTMQKCVGAIRKALGDSAASPRFVETRHREGYRYVGPFAEVAGEGTVEAPAPEAEVETMRAVGIVIEREIGGARPRRVAISASRPAAVAAAVALAVATIALVTRRPAAPQAATLPPAPAAPRSIAVLPLENLTGDPRDAYLADGLADGLITDLSRVNGLKVISRRSAFAFDASHADPREIGSRLGVASILEGSVRRSGDAVRVDVRLVSADDGSVLWADDASGRLTGNLVEVQDALACEVAAGLRVRLCGEGERVSSRYTRDAGAYREYLAGRYHWNRRSDDDMREAVRHYEVAIAADSTYALAYAGLAETYAVMEANSQVAPGEVAAKCRAAAGHALELDDALAGAWAALGLLENCEFDWAAGERDLRRALEVAPSYAPARQWYAHGLLVRGRFEEAEVQFLLARESDPLSYPVAYGLAELYSVWRKYDSAISEARAALEIEPAAESAYWIISKSSFALGRTADALEAGARSGENGRRLMRLLADGNRVEQRRFADELARSAFGERAPYSVACIYASIGDGERALLWLERACEAREADVAMIKVQPELDLVRSDPRYAELLRGLRLDG